MLKGRISEAYHEKNVENKNYLSYLFIYINFKAITTLQTSFYSSGRNVKLISFNRCTSDVELTNLKN